MESLKRYFIRINIGDTKRTVKFYFVAKDQALSFDKQDEMFHEAVTELNHIYKDYGRFATQVGVENLFDKYGFERTLP